MPSEFAAFVEGIVKLQKTQLAYARSLTAGTSLDHEDIVQESVEKAFKKFQQFDPNTNLAAWFNTIIKNTFIDQKKSHSVSRTDPLSGTELDAGGSDTDQYNNQLLREIGKIVDSKVQERDRYVFYMWLQGLSAEEIAEAWSISRSNVAVIVSRVRNLIRKLVEHSSERSSGSASESISIPRSLTLNYYPDDPLDHLEYCEREWRGDQLDRICRDLFIF